MHCHILTSGMIFSCNHGYVGLGVHFCQPTVLTHCPIVTFAFSTTETVHKYSEHVFRDGSHTFSFLWSNSVLPFGGRYFRVFLLFFFLIFFHGSFEPLHLLTFQLQVICASYLRSLIWIVSCISFAS